MHLSNVPTEFYLNIQNRTNKRQKVVLFDAVGAYSGTNAAAGNIKYQWDITTELADALLNTEKTLVLLAAAPGGTYQKFTYVKPSVTGEPEYFATAEQVVTGLNSFGIGTFDNTGNIITGYSNYEISSLNICNLYTAIASTPDANNTLNGSLIYDAGYTTGLIGNLSQISTGNSFWTNIFTTGGPLNRSSINATVIVTPPVNFFGQTRQNAAITVYLGIGFKANSANIYVNNQLVINLANIAAIQAVGNNVNTVLSTAYSINTIMYNCWHIIPVQLQPGNNIIQVETSQAVGMEVYNNTAAEIAAATSYNDLNLLFSSIDYAGDDFF